MKQVIGLVILVCAVGVVIAQITYPIVDTDAHAFYDNTKEISTPVPGDAFYGQDATYRRNTPSYTNNDDGTITDNVTGLMWQQSFDHDGDRKVNISGKLTYKELIKKYENGNIIFAGYDDWRLPTIKEMYSLILFSGRDISPQSKSTKDLKPFINNQVFEFNYGDLEAGERLIDMQCATTTVYVLALLRKTGMCHPPFWH
jgi:hypothetical protein